MMKPTNDPIEVVFEQGRLKPLQHLPLKEHQHAWITILPAEELHAQQIAQLAAKSLSFQFLADPAEDVYSLHDGHPL
jgi:predicted DNA-binding antitoxin AbrB/MazE fold protein